MKSMKFFLAALLLLVLTGKGFAQCSLPECQAMLAEKNLVSEPLRVRLGNSAFATPEKTWQWRTELQVVQVNQEHNPCWLTDLPSCRHTLQFTQARTEISSRVLIYRERGLDNITNEVTLGFHRRPKGFGLVWRRSF